MVLASGTRLGSYEIIGPLGAGGMGEVYRARDTAVGRDVAIKVLPAAFAQDAERLARFEREARVLGSLNHPNIATLHCVEPAGEGRALVMELVEGSGLGEVMRPGTGMRVGEAVAIARQIADALDAAHERGIVHRDLKPANVRLTADGVVKVLDFGLAKSGGEASSNMTNSPTVIGPTASGVVLGTAPYMSPEQARGKLVDKRTDIWAFGCVLYEMLVGRRAFTGETSSDTIAAILDREPDWSALPGSTPAAVRRVLQRCLEKDPKRRLRDIADARADLDQRDPASPTAPGSQRWIGWAAAVLMALVVVALVAAGMTRRRPPNGPALDTGELQQLTLDAGAPTAPSLSADGHLLAYASKRSGRGDLDIWVQQMSGGSPLRVTDDPVDDTDPDLSADGSRVVFRSERDGGGAYVAAALGGPARLAAPEARNPRWSPDSRAIAYWTGQFRGQVAGTNSSVFVLPLSGGTPTRLLSDFSVARDPVWSPDGRALLVVALRTRPAPANEGLDWWYVPIDGSVPSKTGILDHADWRLHMEQERMSAGPWRDAGFVLAIDGGLWSIPLAARGTLSESPRPLVFGAGRVSKPTVSRDNLIVFADQAFERVIERAPLTTADAPLPVVRLFTDGTSNGRRASVTRDGNTIVFESDALSSREIWRKDLSTGAQQLVVGVQSRTTVNPTISPDGTLIGFVTDSAEGLSVTTGGAGYIVSVAGGVPRKICENCGLYEFTADSRRAVITDRDRAITSIDVATGTRLPLVLQPDTGGLDRPSLSPDDRWLAFRRSTGQTAKTYLVPATGNATFASAEQVDEPTTTGRPAGWSPDSRVLYLLLDADGSRCLWGQRVDPATGRLLGKPYVVRHFHELGGDLGSSLGNAVTSQGFLYETLTRRSNLWRLKPAGRVPVE
jgi:Tol biopolymer transport system component